jgi:Rod binding domain-containing protein
MSVDSIAAGVLTTNLSGASPDPTAKDSPEKIRDAASQFEALLIGEVLKTAHEGEGWLGTGEDETASTTMGLADQFLAQSMAKNGGLGLASMVANGLAKRVTEP